MVKIHSVITKKKVFSHFPLMCIILLLHDRSKNRRNTCMFETSYQKPLCCYFYNFMDLVMRFVWISSKCPTSHHDFHNNKSKPGQRNVFGWTQCGVTEKQLQTSVNDLEYFKQAIRQSLQLDETSLRYFVGLM